MQTFTNGILVEINNNFLRVLTSDLQTKELQLDSSIVTDTKITSVENFVPILKDALRSLNFKAKKVSFLLEEKDIYDRFFVVRSDDEDVTATLKSQASSFVGSSLDDLYCVYQKVCPFVYQFIGVKKDSIDTFAQIASKLGLKLEAILPISFVFSRFVGGYGPFFFVFKGIDESTLVAAEYGGVYFSGTYKTSSEINTKMTSLINELSTFNRDKPVTDVMYYGDELSIGKPFTAKKMEMPLEIDLKNYVGFERLLIAYTLVTKSFEEVVGSYFNLRNFVFPTALSKEPKQLALVKYVAPALMVVSLVFALILGFNYLSKNPDSTPEVNGVSESSSSVQPSTEPKEASPTVTPLDKTLLKARVENGAGVAGVAGKAQTFITSFGYKVVEVGNADKFDYEETEILIKDSKKAYADALKADLGKTYSIKSIKTLPEDKPYDVLIIIGKK